MSSSSFLLSPRFDRGANPIHTSIVFSTTRTSKPAAEPLQRAVPSSVALGFSTAAAGSRGTSFGLAEICWLPPTRCFRTSPRLFSEQASHRLRPNGDLAQNNNPTWNVPHSPSRARSYSYHSGCGTAFRCRNRRHRSSLQHRTARVAAVTAILSEALWRALPRCQQRSFGTARARPEPCTHTQLTNAIAGLSRQPTVGPA